MTFLLYALLIFFGFVIAAFIGVAIGIMIILEKCFTHISKFFQGSEGALMTVALLILVLLTEFVVGRIS